MIENLSDRISGKSIAIVGNALSLFSRRYGKQIDEHDCVVRFNKGFIKHAPSQGEKTDILWVAMKNFTHDHVSKYGKPFVICRTEKMANSCGVTNYITEQDIDFMRRDFDLDRPSSGFMALMSIIHRMPKTPVDIYGFDGGETVSFYNTLDYNTPHDFKREMAIYKSLEETGILRIHR